MSWFTLVGGKAGILSAAAHAHKNAEFCAQGTNLLPESEVKDNVSGCPVEEAMRLLGGRWRLLLVWFLLDGPKRFNELRRHLPTISQRMLTLDLRALEQSGMISRTVYPEVPPRVEYALTEEGQRLRPLVGAFQDFGMWLKERGASGPQS
jgi:DNA-binding HxlR family transcriptional regulator